MSALRKLLFLVLIVAMSGCASSHNLSEDNFNSLGGGFIVTQVHEDLYFIEAKTNFAPWKNFGAAENMWNEQAQDACGGREYSQMQIEESSYENGPRFGFVVRYVISVREGYALCSGASITAEEAEALIRDRTNKQL